MSCTAAGGPQRQCWFCPLSCSPIHAASVPPVPLCRLGALAAAFSLGLLLQFLVRPLLPVPAANAGG